MRHFSSAVRQAVVCLASFTVAFSPSFFQPCIAQSAETLDNAAVVQMVLAHLGTDVIIQHIRTTAGAYTLTTGSLIKLKRQGVPDQVGPQAPVNPTTGSHYHGVNVLILGMDERAFMTGDPRWMTYRQAQEKGYQVRKGEKSTTIFFTKPLEVDDADAEEGKRTLRFLKAFSVFHASQIDGLAAHQAPTVEEARGDAPRLPTSS